MPCAVPADHYRLNGIVLKTEPETPKHLAALGYRTYHVTDPDRAALDLAARIQLERLKPWTSRVATLRPDEIRYVELHNEAVDVLEELEVPTGEIPDDLLARAKVAGKPVIIDGDVAHVRSRMINPLVDAAVHAKIGSSECAWLLGSGDREAVLAQLLELSARMWRYSLDRDGNVIRDYGDYDRPSA